MKGPFGSAICLFEAFVLEGGQVALREVPQPVPASGEALVRVVLAPHRVRDGFMVVNPIRAGHGVERFLALDATPRFPSPLAA